MSKPTFLSISLNVLVALDNLRFLYRVLASVSNFSMNWPKERLLNLILLFIRIQAFNRFSRRTVNWGQCMVLQYISFIYNTQRPPCIPFQFFNYSFFLLFQQRYQYFQLLIFLVTRFKHDLYVALYIWLL